MPSLGPEWIIVLVVIILLFGAKKLPELARSVGKSTTEFKKGVKEGGSEAEADATEAKTEAKSEAQKGDSTDQPSG